MSVVRQATIATLVGLIACGPSAATPMMGTGSGTGSDADTGTGSGSDTGGGVADSTGETPPDVPSDVLDCPVSAPQVGEQIFDCGDDVLDCGAHGSCQYVGYDAWQNGDATCRCDTGYTGELCDACEEGFVPTGAECSTPCAAIDLWCVHGSCGGTVDDPACICDGAVGETCDACAPGYVEEVSDTEGGTRCVADCGDCGELLVCSEATQPPACGCADAYEAEGDDCVWPGALDNPGFDGCDGWDLEVLDLDDPSMVAEMVDGQLHLRTEHPCDRVSARATIRYPMPATIAGAALRLHVRGNAGAVLTAEGGGTAEIVGTGAWETVESCIPAGALGRMHPFRLEISSLGSCADDLLQEFWIDEVDVVAGEDCGT